MTPDEKARIREEIEKRLEQIQETMIKLKEQSEPVSPDNAIGRLTRMDAIQQKNMAEANLRAAEETLEKLRLAQEKLDEPGFGVCVKCSKPIPVGRILIIPEVRLCVSCASR